MMIGVYLPINGSSFLTASYNDRSQALQLSIGCKVLRNQSIRPCRLLFELLLPAGAGAPL